MDLANIEKAQGLIERSPAAFLAALLAIALIAAVGLWVRTMLRMERLQRVHQRELARLRDAHSERVDKLQKEQLLYAVRLEGLMQAFLQRVEGRGRRKPATDPGLAPKVTDGD